MLFNLKELKDAVFTLSFCDMVELRRTGKDCVLLSGVIHAECLEIELLATIAIDDVDMCINRKFLYNTIKSLSGSSFVEIGNKNGDIFIKGSTNNVAATCFNDKDYHGRCFEMGESQTTLLVPLNNLLDAVMFVSIPTFKSDLFDTSIGICIRDNKIMSSDGYRICCVDIQHQEAGEQHYININFDTLKILKKILKKSCASEVSIRRGSSVLEVVVGNYKHLSLQEARDDFVFTTRCLKQTFFNKIFGTEIVVDTKRLKSALVSINSQQDKGDVVKLGITLCEMSICIPNKTTTTTTIVLLNEQRGCNINIYVNSHHLLDALTDSETTRLMFNTAKEVYCVVGVENFTTYIMPVVV